MTFDEGPFGDPVFAAVCTGSGDGSGLSWKLAGDGVRSGQDGIRWRSSGERGIGPGDLHGVSSRMPRFRYGLVDNGPYLTIDSDRWTYVRRGDVVAIYLRTALPETVLAALIGRRVADVAEVPGIDGRIVVAAEPTVTAGVCETMLSIGDPTDAG